MLVVIFLDSSMILNVYTMIKNLVSKSTAMVVCINGISVFLKYSSDGNG